LAGLLICLSSSRAGPESAKQAEIRLAGLLKILGFYLSNRETPAKNRQGCVSSPFPPDMANLSKVCALLFRSQF
jgi:hypothetical protein